MSEANQQPSEEQMRAYIEQLRAADPSEIIAQAFTLLGTGGEVKLGRPDARVLIDAAAALVEATAGRLPAELHEGMRAGVTQLQTAQVQAEREAGAHADASGREEAAGTKGDAAQGQPSPPPSAPPSAAPRAPQQGGQPSDGSMTDRLWVPGRD